MIKLIKGDCLEVLKRATSESVDSIVTDPPYELGFMGKHWDNSGIAYNVDLWREALRVLKPGGHLLAFGGTRTYHRMASAIEDAGFEVRDMIEWVYGSGFPKSLNISKSIENKMLTGNASKNGFHKLEGERREGRIGMYDTVEEQGFRKVNPDQLGAFDLEPTTDEAKQWEGWGTALKPAHEPICMARKPLAEKTVAENVLKWGVGGINIDGCRIPTEDKTGREVYQTQSWKNTSTKGVGSVNDDWKQGRFPANLIHDNSEEVRECFPESKSTQRKNPSDTISKPNIDFGGGWKSADNEYADSGNASRFFKSIMTDSLCTLCCLPFDIKHDTMSVCNNTNVNSAEKSLKTTQATTEAIAPQNATTPDNKKFVQNVRFVGRLCDLCGTYIALVLAGEKPAHQEEEARGQIFITEQKKQILDNALASFVELRGKKDTTLTINNLNLLFGYVFNAIENSTIYSEQEKEGEKNHEKKSLIYQAKASKSERNKGCEGLEEKEKKTLGSFGDQSKFDCPDGANRVGNKGTSINKNNHPTVKPIALMSYLIKMVTPKGGTVLDPFMGSGSTGVAAHQNGYGFIGIEREADYIKIAEARIK